MSDFVALKITKQPSFKGLRKMFITIAKFNLKEDKTHEKRYESIYQMKFKETI